MPKATAKQIRDARLVVYARDQHRCQMCGQSVVDIPSSIHHRINRGMGGSGNLERWLLPKLNADLDPTKEPLLTYQGWRLFDDVGGSVECDPPAGAVDWVDGTVA